jgi:hypothetical protein
MTRTTCPKQHLINRLTSTAEAEQRTVDKFAKRVSEDPVYAFQWGDTAMASAVLVQQCRRVRDALEQQDPKQAVTLEQMAGYLSRNICNGARYPEASTSSCANLIKRYELAALTQILEMIEQAQAM